MLVLSIDPGKRAGWCLWSTTEGYRCSDIVDGDSMVAAVNLLEYWGPAVLICEDQHLGKIKAKHGRGRGETFLPSPKAVKTLMRRRHIWELAAQERGIRFHVVNPRTWMGWYRIRAGDKEAINHMARLLTRRVVKDDEADAVLIANYWVALESSRKAGLL